MTGYTTVITGVRKGTGLDLAKRMIGKGYRVISIARHAPEE